MAQDLRENRLFTYTSIHKEIDPINRRVLEELQRDPRLTMSELGRRIGMSSPAVTERVHRLEEAGVIRGYRLELNPAALGLPIAAYVRIRPNPGQLPKIAELARQIPEVVECHRVTGEDCFVLKVYIPAIEQLDRILDCFLLYGTTTTTIIQSSPVPLRPLPLPENSSGEE
ncbi:Lrp/AsnC family transcriptional regulator [Ktedonosporobacter rubrisoli]|uniref:Lrp/AsnC family transcriptional regulator n=1 Tax=Ktedonosporobacter rubrisoli TaxID=2509675 RepID=A0A4P6JLK9_KTERU|nr:Lrp/AsnC family transcriptional regulator [Ktedonosporobacter rubrisoli]QBD76137.1 Lrp/AsnC family transcriptional regulator [Ktedonosporobacter rubrisoli]